LLWISSFENIIKTEAMLFISSKNYDTSASIIFRKYQYPQHPHIHHRCSVVVYLNDPEPVVCLFYIKTIKTVADAY